MDKCKVNRNDVVKIALFAIAYFLSHQISFFFPDQAKVLMAIWPAGGIGLAALLLNPRRLWLLTVVVLFLTGNLADLLAGRPFIASFGFMVANILESLGCAWLILRICGDNVSFNRVKEVLALIAAAILVNACTAFIGASAAVFTHGDQFWNFWISWFIADGLGILLITPLIVTWAVPQYSLPRFRWGSAVEFVVFLILWCAISSLSFNTLDIFKTFTPKPYMISLFLVWPALRFGQRGVTFALIILAGITVTGADVATGPLLLGGHSMAERLLLAQIFLGIIAITGFILAASQMEVRSALRIVADEQEKLSAFMYNSPSLVYLKDLAGRLLLVNQRFVELFGGSSPADFLGKTSYDVVEPVNAKEHDANDRRVKATGMPLTIEELSEQKDGCHVYLTTKFPVKNTDGKIWAVGGVSTDITDRKRTQDALQREVSLRGTLLENLPCIAMILKKRTREIIYANAAAKQAGAIIGKACYETIPKTQEPCPFCLAPDVWSSNSPGLVEVEYQGKCYEGRWIPLDDDRYVHYIFDTTERKRLEDTKKKLLVAVSHSLKTPVVMIEMALDMMKRGIESNDSSRIEKGGDIIHDNVVRLRKDMGNMLKVFTLDLIKTPLSGQQEQKLVSLRKIVDDILRERGPEIEKKGLKFVIDIPSADDMVGIEEREIAVILDNLIDNALKFTNEGGIFVSSRRKDDLLELRVKDTGCGISQEYKDKLFDMFFKQHVAVEGLGLGLFICKGLVDLFGGTIQVDSDGPGKGTEVLIRLPMKNLFNRR